MPQLPIAFEILRAMMTPAVLISASGTLALSTSNRFVETPEADRVQHSRWADSSLQTDGST